jgi:hypothetical protein
MRRSYTTADSKNVQLGQHSQYSDFAIVYGLNPRQAKRVFSSAKHPDWLWALSSLLFKQYWCSLKEVRQLGHEAYHSLPSRTKVNNECSYTSLAFGKKNKLQARENLVLRKISVLDYTTNNFKIYCMPTHPKCLHGIDSDS